MKKKWHGSVDKIDFYSSYPPRVLKSIYIFLFSTRLLSPYIRSSSLLTSVIRLQTSRLQFPFQLIGFSEYTWVPLVIDAN